MGEVAGESSKYILAGVFVVVVLSALAFVFWPKITPWFENLPSNYSLPQTSARDVGTVRYDVASGTVQHYDGQKFVAVPAEGIEVQGVKLSAETIKVSFENVLYAPRKVQRISLSTGTATISNSLLQKTEINENTFFRFWGLDSWGMTISGTTLLPQAGDAYITYTPTDGSLHAFLVRFPSTLLYCDNLKKCGGVPSALQADAEQITQAALAWRRASYVNLVSFGGSVTGCVREEEATLVAKLGMNQESC